jgi:phospholipid/cholesterol/gamma-HCH transport system substrate-binding protein
LSAPIPFERTRSPYQLPDALGDLSTTVTGLNTNAVSDALATISQTFQDTPPDLKAAVDGVARFSQTLDTRDQQLRNLLANANKATTVLSERADQVAGLVAGGGRIEYLNLLDAWRAGGMQHDLELGFGADQSASESEAVAADA